MKCVCQENKVRWCSQVGNVVSVARYEIAIRYAVFGEPMACDLKQIRININRAYVSSDTAARTPAGSGQSASHHPAVGISVPSKKPGGWSSLMKPLPRCAHQT